MQIAGGDPITARFLYGEYFEFYPEFKVFWAANHKPIIQGTDHGIWRRIFLIPFNVTIPADQIDRNLSEKLFGELPGIFTWAVRGCTEWQEHGLNPPAEVRSATALYRDEQDILGEFLSIKCHMDTNMRISKKVIYNVYKEFCTNNGDKPIGKIDFGSKLKERGITEKKSGEWYWIGIGLKSKPNTETNVIPMHS